MSNIIHVDFGRKNEVTVLPQARLLGKCGLVAYLNSLREQGIDEDDISSITEAIADKECYFLADDEVRAFADAWFDATL